MRDRAKMRREQVCRGYVIDALSVFRRKETIDRMIKLLDRSLDGLSEEKAEEIANAYDCGHYPNEVTK